MSEQGERHVPGTGAQQDWWARLYEPGAPDTGGSADGDTLDDRFASARVLGVPPAVGDDAHGPGAESGRGETFRGAGDPATEAVASPAPAGGAPDRPEWLDRLFGTGDPDDAEPPATGRVGAGEALREPVRPTPGIAPGRERPSSATGAGEEAGRVRSRRSGLRGAFGARRPHDGPAPDPGRARRGALPEPGPPADVAPEAVADLVPDTVLDGARHGHLVVRAVSARGGSSRLRGDPRAETVLTARFGSADSGLLFAAVAAAAGDAPAGRRAARDLCRSLGEAVGRSRARLAEDIADARDAALSGGLKRLTDRCYGRLRAQAAALGHAPDAYHADLCALLVPTDPGCRNRVAFGAGAGALFLLRDGAWTDLAPPVEELPAEPAESTALLPPPRGLDATQGGEPGPPAHPAFRFRTLTAAPGDLLLLCGEGLAEPLRGPTGCADDLAAAWSEQCGPPDPAHFLTDVQYPEPGQGVDRTAVAIWDTDPR
ncbi:protein phosphatase 2C domain-containing protein [Streptomyces sp. TR06-5]|uniref:protein phosphatase 2C domain-containing protein n=1 Tax=Streptomyces sp. TR06-5 TaxID=3385976 RepID=UPI0039A182C6